MSKTWEGHQYPENFVKTLVDYRDLQRYPGSPPRLRLQKVVVPWEANAFAFHKVRM